MQATSPPTQQGSHLDRAGIRRIFTVLLTQLLYAVILFGCAGRLDWWAAWAYLAVSLLGVGFLGLTVGRKHPEVINERGGKHENQKRWDKIVTAFYGAFGLSMLAVAGLDARFGWSDVPLWVQFLGLAGVVFEFGMVAWVMNTNPYLSTVVRIQDDRGHRVISTGPYAIIRHPMYAGLLVVWFAIPLFLGSWWALVPGALAAAALVVRTAMEDRTLQAELPGYADYAHRVRYRLVPRVW